MDNKCRERFMELLYFCNSTKAARIDDLHKSLSQGSTLRSIFETYDRGEKLVDIGAYCLMPNHFHLLVKEVRAGGIALFMQKLSTGYTMYFNTRYNRSGALFQGKYKARHVTGDRYLKYLFSYIHLNPVKLVEPGWKKTGIAQRANARTYLAEYQYSSFPDYCGNKRAEQDIISMEMLTDYYDLQTPKNFKDTVEAWLDHGE